MKLADLRAWGRDVLRASSIENYAHETDILLMDTLDMDKNALLTKGDFEPPTALVELFRKSIDRRRAHMPLQYVVGRWEFMSLEFNLGAGNVLIPRADTEVLVQTIMAEEPPGARGLEIGLGSGCISIALEYHGDMVMTGVEICPDALEVAKANHESIFGRQNVFGGSAKKAQKRASRFILSDLFQNVPRGTLFDFIVSNPPYISKGEIEMLNKSVKDFEPHVALYGGDDGLDFYKKIVAVAGEYLVPDGGIYFEIGRDQADAVKKILYRSGFSDINIVKDLARHDRVIFARWGDWWLSEGKNG
jgi:release factor glutamine methyltransferase